MNDLNVLEACPLFHVMLLGDMLPGFQYCFNGRTQKELYVSVDRINELWEMLVSKIAEAQKNETQFAFT